jgi:hypothetical protein
MTDFDHPDNELGILYRVDDAVISLTKTVFFLTGEFFASNWTGVCGKAFDPIDDPLQVICRDYIQVLPDRIFEKDAIDGHCL